MQFSEDLLIESPTARSQGLVEIKSQSREQEVLSKVKALFFAVWDGTPRISRHHLAEFYEVSLDAINKNYQRFKDEFELDGVKVVRGNDLKEVKDILSLTSFTPQEVIYTPAGALRMGFILRDSPVAKRVRTMAIRVIQGVGDLVNSKVALAKFIEGHIGLDQFAENEQPKISAPYDESSYKIAYKELKKKYPNEKLPNLGAEQLKEFFAFLSTYTDGWALRTDYELASPHASDRYGYPHLTSHPFPVEVEGQVKHAVVMFQFCNFFVDDNYVRECDSRRYIRSSKNLPGVDLAWLFFVSPFGANPKAVSFIQQEIRDDAKGYMGVLLVKDLANFLYAQASKTRSSNLINGEINKKFSHLRGYDVPVIELVTQYELF